MRVVKIRGKALLGSQLRFVRQSIKREFGVSLSDEELRKPEYFFLMEKNQIKAQCQLIPLQPFYLEGREFALTGFGSLIATPKGRGYGSDLFKYLTSRLKRGKRSIIGFCDPGLADYYRSRGFMVDAEMRKRFYSLDQIFTGSQGLNENIMYLNGEDNFFGLLASKPKSWVLSTQHLRW